MTDADRHSPTPTPSASSIHALVTLDLVSAQFEAAGLPRSLRTLQRYCGNGTLDCVKEATDTGDTYFVRTGSIDTAIAALRQLHEAKDRHRQPSPMPDMSSLVDHRLDTISEADHVRPGPTTTDTDAEPVPSRQAATTPDTTRLVTQLETRLEEKDAEISFLREELTNRRDQIRDMKGIIDGQNKLLETININVAPVFQALATAVDKGRIPAPQGDLGQTRQADPSARPWLASNE
jgi:hypothetical protein